MTDRTAAERMRAKRQRDREEKGIVGVLVRVPESRKEEILAIAAAMRGEIDEKEQP